MLAFAAGLSAGNYLYYLPSAERALEEQARARVVQELTRLQSALEYLLLKGDLEGVRREIALLASNPEFMTVALVDDARLVIASTRLAWLRQDVMEVLPSFDVAAAARVARERRILITIAARRDSLTGYASVLLGATGMELRPTRLGYLYFVYDLIPGKSFARARIRDQSLVFAVLVGAFAVALGRFLHLYLTRRVERLVHAAEQLAAGNLGARGGLRGRDELARLSQAFDTMADQIAETQSRLHQDIAARARIQRALEDSEALLRQIVNNATAVVYVKDTQGRYLLVNRQFERIFHRPTAEILGQTDGEIVPETMAEIGELYRRNDRLVLERNAPLEFEETALQDDGVHTYISIKFPLYTAAGEVYAVGGISTDITQRKAAEEALRESEERYRAIFDATNDTLILWDAVGNMVDCNPAVSRIGQYPREEFLALQPSDYIHPSSYPTLEEFLRRLARGESMRAELQALRKDGSVLEMEMQSIPMVHQGRPHMLTVSRDVTEEKRAAEALARQREALHQREKLAALGSLLAGVAHELNNPLAIILARATLLEEGDHAPTRAAAAKIRTAAERCARIVRTFLAMARQRPPERSAVVLNDLITAALEVLGYALRTSDVGVALDLAANLPSISADADQIHQVIMNLLVNAQQALQDRPLPRRIHIASHLEPGGNSIRVVVADNGPGVPEAIRARIFEPYFTTKPIGVGTGVGLSVSLGIIEAHGGTFALDHPPEGGAMFTIVLPVGSCEAPVLERPPVRAAATAVRVLVVDDEAEVRDALCEILKADGHRVATAACGREALERMSTEPYDVVLTDLRMPDLDGQALYREIERRWPEKAARLVFITGDTLSPALLALAAGSGRPVIEKPFLPPEVRRVIAEVVAGL